VLFCNNWFKAPKILGVVVRVNCALLIIKNLFSRRNRRTLTGMKYSAKVIEIIITLTAVTAMVPRLLAQPTQARSAAVRNFEGIAPGHRVRRFCLS
jgi:hypothetical protein